MPPNGQNPSPAAECDFCGALKSFGGNAQMTFAKSNNPLALYHSCRLSDDIIPLICLLYKTPQNLQKQTLYVHALKEDIGPRDLVGKLTTWS